MTFVVKFVMLDSESFQELENRIRPGQIYGGPINGENLRRAAEIFYLIEGASKEVLYGEKPSGSGV